MPEKLLGSFLATGEDGRRFMVNVFEKYDDAMKSLSQRMATSCGLQVTKVSKGYYETVPEGRRLLSTDREAP